MLRMKDLLLVPCLTSLRLPQLLHETTQMLRMKDLLLVPFELLRALDHLRNHKLPAWMILQLQQWSQVIFHLLCLPRQPHLVSMKTIRSRTWKKPTLPCFRLLC